MHKYQENLVLKKVSTFIKPIVNHHINKIIETGCTCNREDIHAAWSQLIKEQIKVTQLNSENKRWQNLPLCLFFLMEENTEEKKEGSGFFCVEEVIPSLAAIYSAPGSYTCSLQPIKQKHIIVSR